MNKRSPTVTLTTREGERLRELAREKGEHEAIALLGLDARTYYKAAAERPIARLTADVIRSKLDRI